MLFSHIARYSCRPKIIRTLSLRQIKRPVKVAYIFNIHIVLVILSEIGRQSILIFHIKLFLNDTHFCLSFL